MHFSTIFSLGVALFASSSLAQANTDPPEFHVENFKYSCASSPCTFSFDVYTSGAASNFANILTPRFCSGTSKLKAPLECAAPEPASKQIFAYINNNGELDILYRYIEFSGPNKGEYSYEGLKAVEPNKAGRANFVVPITKVSADPS